MNNKCRSLHSGPVLLSSLWHSEVAMKEVPSPCDNLRRAGRCLPQEGESLCKSIHQVRLMWHHRGKAASAGVTQTPSGSLHAHERHLCCVRASRVSQPGRRPSGSYGERSRKVGCRGWAQSPGCLLSRTAPCLCWPQACGLSHVTRNHSQCTGLPARYIGPVPRGVLASGGFDLGKS